MTSTCRSFGSRSATRPRPSPAFFIVLSAPAPPASGDRRRGAEKASRRNGTVFSPASNPFPSPPRAHRPERHSVLRAVNLSAPAHRRPPQVYPLDGWHDRLSDLLGSGHVGGRRSKSGTRARAERSPGILDFKEYPAVTRPGMLDTLLSLPFEFVLSQSFCCLAKDDAKAVMTRKQNQMVSAGDRALKAKSTSSTRPSTISNRTASF